MHVVNVGIIWVLEAFFGHVYSAFGICISIRVFTAVYGLLPVYGLWSALCIAMVAVHKPTSQQFANVADPIRRRNTATLKNYQRLGYQQLFGYVHTSLRRAFQEAG